MIESFMLKGKTVLVTGASSGIGRQIAIHISRAGAQVILNGRNEVRLQATLSQLEGTAHICLPGDLTNKEDVEKIMAAMPVVDGVAFASGVLKISPFKILQPEELQQLMATNFFSPVTLVQLMLNEKKIGKGASVVFIASVNGLYKHVRGFSAYAASKAALDSLCKTLALEYGGRNIRFNTIAPGMIKTEMLDSMREILSDEMIAQDKKNYPLGDYGDPEDVANACLFLLAPASKWITGTSLIVDGGLTI